VKRQGSEDDRRRIRLNLTHNGEALLAKARQETQAHLEERLAVLPETKIEEVMRAMQSLRPVFTSGEAVEEAPGG
jgi:DNA-binding MarR family transcriptional regulator